METMNRSEIMEALEEFASRLDGREYRSEVRAEDAVAAANQGVVIVYGASDDIVELAGAIDDEVGAYDGITFQVTGTGLLRNECECEDCPYHAREKARAASIEAVWDPAESEASWIYRTKIPHATFEIFEDDELYCVGIVFSLDLLA